jgi:hypothetical protein
MRLFEKGAFATPVRDVLDGLLVIVGFLICLEAVLVAILLVNPDHPFKERFRVTTMAAVSPTVWPTDSLVRIEPGSASAAVDPVAFITFRPSTRVFVFVTAIASFAWWACFVLVLLQLRRVLSNMTADAPFPRANIRHIRLVGWGILGTALANLLIDAGMLIYLQSAVTVADRPPVVPPAIMLVDFPLGTIMAGLAVLILAEIFRAGADLQDDQSLTV